MSGSLPSGWQIAHSTQGDPFAPIALVLSLLLALMICALIGGVVWRRKRYARQHRDLEKKKYPPFGDDTETVTEDLKRYRSHQKMWAKATARWKANVRLSARRRRKRPQSSSADADIPHQPSTASLASQYSYVSESASNVEKSDSYSADDDATLTSTAHDFPYASENDHRDEETPRAQHTDSASEVPPDSSRPTLPPEYPLDGALLGVHNERLGPSVERLDASETRAPSLDRSGATNASHSALSSHDHLPYTAPVDSAHIATDDKTLLARMANLASRPPVEGSARESSFHGESASAAGPSVPIFDEFEELPVEIQVVDEDGPSGSQVWHPIMSASSPLSVHIPVPTYSREPSPHPSIFPAPPSKAQLAAPLFYEYPSSFEADGVDPELEAPSAPPFDYSAPGPSAPPLDGGSIDMDSVACAPPLIDEEEEIQLGFIPSPSAPPLSEVMSGRTNGRVSPSEAGPSSSRLPPCGRPSAPFSPRAASPPDYLP
ncbi:hypothetical protein NM688_g9076 [Phlebia brevispora]|uniref:Uncharacterized protein n=1 Tax=Phlebia brevispora TaxID=194682 RepID=A0ACC1RK99_9APHY|nr:hypothetical protein NM688_g9076 [Phlebia brevispora]